MVNIQELEIPWKELRHECDPASFSFRTTSEIDPADEVIGQQRAVRAIEFGLSIRNHGYNIFVSGIPGTGKNTIVKSIVQKISLDRPVPDDWCYINNFKEPDHPRAIKLPPGMARTFQRDMERFIEFMLAEIPRSSSPRSTRAEERRFGRPRTVPRDPLQRGRARRRSNWGSSLPSPARDREGPARERQAPAGRGARAAHPGTAARDGGAGEEGGCRDPDFLAKCGSSTRRRMSGSTT